MAGGVYFPEAEDIWLPPLSLIMVLPQLWGLFPAPTLQVYATVPDALSPPWNPSHVYIASMENP